MNCPSCGFANSTGQKFCGECGYKLTQPASSSASAQHQPTRAFNVADLLGPGATEPASKQKPPPPRQKPPPPGGGKSTKPTKSDELLGLLSATQISRPATPAKRNPTEPSGDSTAVLPAMDLEALAAALEAPAAKPKPAEQRPLKPPPPRQSAPAKNPPPPPRKEAAKPAFSSEDFDLESLADGFEAPPPKSAPAQRPPAPRSTPKPPAAADFDLESLADGFESALNDELDLESLASGFESPPPPRSAQPANLLDDLEALADGFGGGDDLEALADSFGDSTPKSAPPQRSAAPPARSAEPDFDDLEALASNFEAATAPAPPAKPAAPAKTPPAQNPPPAKSAAAQSPPPAKPAPAQSPPPAASRAAAPPAKETAKSKTPAPPPAADPFDDLEALAADFGKPEPPPPQKPTSPQKPATPQKPASPDPLADLEALAADFASPSAPPEDLDALAAGLEQSLMDWQAQIEPPATATPRSPQPPEPVPDRGDWSDLDALADEFSENDDPESLSNLRLAALSAELNEKALRELESPPQPEEDVLDDLAAGFQDEDGDDDEERLLLENRVDFYPALTPSAAPRESKPQDAMDELADLFEGEDDWSEPFPNMLSAAPAKPQPPVVPEPPRTAEPPRAAEPSKAIEKSRVADKSKIVEPPKVETSKLVDPPKTATPAASAPIGPPVVEQPFEESAFEPASLEADRPEPTSLSKIIRAEEADFLDGFSEALGVDVPQSRPAAPASGFVEAQPEAEGYEASAEAWEPEALAEDEGQYEAEMLPEEAAEPEAPEEPPLPRHVPEKPLFARFAPVRASSDTKPAPPPVEAEEAAPDDPYAEAPYGSAAEDGYGSSEDDAAAAFEEAEAAYGDEEQPEPPPPPPPRPAPSRSTKPALDPVRAQESVAAWDDAVSQIELEMAGSAVYPTPDSPVPTTVLLSASNDPGQPLSPAQKPARRALSLGGILGKVLILLLAGGLGLGGFYAYNRYLKTRPGQLNLEGDGPLPPLEIPAEPVTEESLRRAIAAQPDQPANYDALASLLREKGKTKEADLIQSGKPKGEAAATSPALPPESESTPAAAAAPTPKAPVPTPGPDAAQQIAELLAKGKRLAAEGKGPEAIQLFEDALKIEGNNHDALLDLGSTQWKLGQMDTAYETLSRLLRLHPKSAIAHNELGMVQQRRATSQEGWANAIDLYLKAVALDPKLTEAYTNLGTAYETIGDNAKAMEMRRKAVELSPENAEAHAQLGLSYLAMEQAEPARTEIEKAISLDPDEGIYHSNLGYWYVVQGEAAQALPFYRKAIQLQPQNANHYSELGSALLLLEKNDEALKVFLKAVELDPGNALYTSNLAFAYKAKGELETALEQFEKAAQLEPRDSQIQLGLAGTLEGLKKTTQAIAAYKKSIQFDNCNFVASYNLASLYQNKIRYKDAAIEEWNRYIGMVEKCGIQGQEDFIQKARDSLKELDY